MKRLRLASRVQRSLENRGFTGSIRHYSHQLYSILRPLRIKPHPFDLRNGVYTTALIQGRQLASGHANDLYNVCYLPSHPSMVTGAIDIWRGLIHPDAPQLEDYTFIDIGAGMGRAVMVASQYAFREIVGVELSPRLCTQARRNLEIWQHTAHACNELQIANCDAAEYPWPHSPIVVYLFNPFEQPVLVQLIASLERAQPAGAGPIDILYVHPIAAACLDAHPRIQLLASQFCYLSEEDRAADPYNDPTSPFDGVDCRIYRLAPV